MNTIKIWNNSASERQLRDIGERLRTGEIAIIPTDSLYAIVCDALNVKAVERVCRLKGINPEKSNLSIICSDIAMASQYARIDDKAYRLIKEYTPGPVTFLLRAASTLPKAFKGRKIVGIRIPDCEFDRKLADFMQSPLLTTSIEFENEDYAVNTELISEAYDGRVELMVAGDDGSTEESTIIDCTGDAPVITREGKADIEL